MLYTFLTGFLLALTASVQTLDAENVTKGVVFAVIVSAIRAGIKLVGEKFLAVKD